MDTIAPQAVQFDPPNYSTSFSEDKFKVKFDEYIELKKVKEQLIISPPLEKSPKVKVKGKTMTVSFKGDTLKENATYIFNFNNAIVDYTENNPAKQFQYTFSTGSNIDTLQVSGNLTHSKDNKAVEDVYVFLYANHADSAPRTIIPDYIAKTDKKGNFTFKSVAEKPYRLFALNDKNQNMLFDQALEEIAFYDKTFTPSAEYKAVYDTIYIDSVFTTTDDQGNTIKQRMRRDSVVKEERTVFSPSDLKLRLFENETDKQFITNQKRVSKKQICIGFNKVLHKDYFKYEIEGQELTDKSLTVERFAPNDSVCFWLEDTALVHNDSLSILVSYYKSEDSITTDTVSPRLFSSLKKKKAKTALTINTTKSTFNPSDSLIIEYTMPLGRISAEKMGLYTTSDSTGFRKRNNDFFMLDSAKAPIVASRHRPAYAKFHPDSIYTEQSIKRSQRIKHRFYIEAKRPLQEYPIQLRLKSAPEKTNWYVSEIDSAENIMYVWITDQSVLKMKNQVVEVLYKTNQHTKTADLFTDYVFEKEPNIKIDKLDLLIPEAFQKEHFLDEYLPLLCSNPVKSIDTSKIKIVDLKDSLSAPLQITTHIYKQEPMKVWLDIPFLANKKYSVLIEKGAITDIYDLVNKEQEFIIQSQKKARHKVRKAIEFAPIAEENKRKAYIKAKLEAGENYELAVSPDAIADVYGDYVDSTVFTFKTLPADEYGTLIIDCQKVDDNYIFMLLDSDDKLILQQEVNRNTRYTFPNLMPGKYKFLLIKDRNENEKWDTGNYDKGIQPEEKYLSETPLEIRKDWEEVITIEFKPLFK